MKHLVIKFLFVTLGLIAFSTNLSSQSKATKNARKMIQEDMENFQKLIDSPETLNAKTIPSYGVAGSYEKKQNIKDGNCTPEDYSIPKKVGILAFYISDGDYSTYSSDWVTTYKATEEKVNAVAQRIFDQSIDGLKEQYALLGMELLTPDEFLTTEELKNIYYNYPLPNLEGKADVWGAAGSGAAIPDGFRLLPYASIGIAGNKYAKEQFGFFKALDLDAFIVVDIGLIAANGSITGINAMFYYKNPGWETSGMEGIGVIGYTPYTTGHVGMNFKPVMKGLFIKEEQEYTTKKGKTDIKFVPVDVNPNVSILVEHVVTRLGKLSVDQITLPVKMKKKKKKK